MSEAKNPHECERNDGRCDCDPCCYCGHRPELPQVDELSALRAQVTDLKDELHAADILADALRAECAALREKDNSEYRQILRESAELRVQNDDLNAECAALKKELVIVRRELSYAQDNNHKRNVELDTLHYVWCNGGCAGGVHRFGEHPELTEEIVAAAERNTKRLRQWLSNHEGRIKYAAERRDAVLKADGL